MKTFRHLPNPPALKELEVITEDTGRRYKTPDGLWYPSITTVLSIYNKEGLERWKDRVGEEYAESVKRRAGNRGTRFHNFAEKYLNNENPDLNTLNVIERDIFQNAIPAIDRIDDIIIQECPLYSDYLQTAGRTDCIGHYEGKRSVIDFKTATREKDLAHVEHYFMQCTAYSIMFEERTGIPITNLVLIIATDNGFVQVLKSKRDRHVEGLLHVRKQYRDLFGI